MKKQFALLIAGLFAGSLFAFSNTAQAVDTTGTVDYTDGGITFDPQVPGNASASLPKNLNFGSHAIQTTKDEIWTATSDGVQTSPNKKRTYRPQNTDGQTTPPRHYRTNCS